MCMSACGYGECVRAGVCVCVCVRERESERERDRERETVVCHGLTL